MISDILFNVLGLDALRDAQIPAASRGDRERGEQRAKAGAGNGHHGRLGVREGALEIRSRPQAGGHRSAGQAARVEARPLDDVAEIRVPAPQQDVVASSARGGSRAPFPRSRRRGPRPSSSAELSLFSAGEALQVLDMLENDQQRRGGGRDHHCARGVREEPGRRRQEHDRDHGAQRNVPRRGDDADEDRQAHERRERGKRQKRADRRRDALAAALAYQ